MAVRAGLEPCIDLRIAAEAPSGLPGVVICARRPGA